MKRSLNITRCCAGALTAAVFAIAAPLAHGQSVEAPGAPAGVSDLQAIIVTGTRQTGISAANSPAPIQILTAASMQAAAGNPDLMSTLAQIVPSLQMSATGFDMANQTLQARLKGLSSNHVLVLVNGKRRHHTANIAIDSGNPYQGGASVDLNMIPQEAIDHIEVLTEGAAAQYGSDAIAGVINIILKKDSSGGSITGLYGADYDGAPQGSNLPGLNGATNMITGNIGFEPFDGAYLNLTGEIHKHGFTFRGSPDPRVTPPYYVNGCTAANPVCNGAAQVDSQTANVAGYPYLNHIQGDAESHSKLVAFNAGYDFGNGTEIYAFGTYGNKYAASVQNYRLPDVYNYTDPTTGVTYYPLPSGFSPQEAIQENDYAATIGIKGTLAGWNWDFSSEWGADHIDSYTLDSVNEGEFAATGLPITVISATGALGHGYTSPVSTYAGLQLATQWTTTLDVSHDWDIGMAGPLNTAGGIELRRDGFEIGAGEPNSYLLGGPAGWAGFSPTSASTHSRENYAAYVDVSGKPIDALRIDLAGRFEHYSDFGNAPVGKLTARYDFAPEFAIRGTISNGFRAPTMEEEFYSDNIVGPNNVIAQFAPNSSAAEVLGLGKLQPEKSTNLSLGFVWRPLPAMSATLDLYQIRITNRIFGTGALNGEVNGEETSNLVNSALSAAGVPINSFVTNTIIELFANAFNTTTNGADLAFQFPVDYSIGHVDWTVAGTLNATKVTKVRATPAQLVPALDGGVSMFNPQTISDVEEASPKFVLNLGMNYTYDRFTLSILEKIYGKTSEWENDDADNPENVFHWYKTTIGVTPITNIDLGFNLTKQLKVDIGANNAFNRFPGLENPALIRAFYSSSAAANNDPIGSSAVPVFSPFGIDGGFYYVHAAYRF
jgi:iron complex outermembrane recepter protein